VANHIEDGPFAFVRHQAKAASDFLIGFCFATKVTTEPVLVEFLASFNVPQPATIGADFVGENDS
jgi:hypothetical protein